MTKLMRSFSFAWQGIRSCSTSERNFIIHLGFAALVIFLGIYFHIRSSEWVEIGICISLVLSMEMINTAIEHLCNIVHSGPHPGIKKVKDISAGAVLVSAFLAAACGAFIFIPKIFNI